MRHAHTICHQLYPSSRIITIIRRRHLNFSIFSRNYLGISLITSGMFEKEDEQCWLWIKLNVSHTHNHDCVGVDLFLKHKILLPFVFRGVHSRVKNFLSWRNWKFNNLRENWLLTTFPTKRVEVNRLENHYSGLMCGNL